MKGQNGWRTPALIQEASRNALNWSSRQTISIAAAILIGLAIAAVSFLDFTGLTATLGRLQDEGRNLIVVQSANPQEPAKISVPLCEQLVDIPAIARAGTVVPLRSANLTQLGPHVPIVGVSPSLLPRLATVDAIVGSSLGLRAGNITLIVDGAPEHAQVGAAQPDALGTNSAVAVALPPTMGFSPQCLVELKKYESITQVAPVILAELRSAGGPVIAAPQLKESFNVLAAYRDRPDRWLPLGAGALGALIALTLLVMRSSELAAYRLSGTSSTDLIKLLVVEQILLAGTTVAFGSFGLVVARLLNPELPTSAFLWPWLTGLSWLVAFASVVPFAARRSPAQLARDR